MYILTNKKNMRDDEVILVDIKQFRAISPEEIEVKDDKGILSLDNVIKVRFDPPHGEDGITGVILGTYETFERCSEIIAEIADAIEGGSIVYRMPVE